jgi:nicotinamide riboside kinase
LKATWIEEYAREYLIQNNGKYNIEDLDKIAVGQTNKWKDQNCDFLICDTEMTVLKIWSEVKYQHVSNAILKYYDEQQFDFYFLCRPDIPWEEDVLRENPYDRNELFERYKNELEGYKRDFSILEGSIENRVHYCAQKINQLINASF